MFWTQVYLWGALVVFALTFALSSFGCAMEREEKARQGCGANECVDFLWWTFSAPQNKIFASLACLGLDTTGNLIFGIIMGITWPIVICAVICCLAFVL